MQKNDKYIKTAGVILFTGIGGYFAYRMYKKYQLDRQLVVQQTNTVIPNNPSSTRPAMKYNIGGNLIPSTGVSLSRIVTEIYENSKFYPVWFSPKDVLTAAKEIPVAKVWEVAKLYQDKYNENMLDTLAKVLSTSQFTEIKYYFK